MKPGEDGVNPYVVFHNGRFEYGTARKVVISAAPVMTRIGFAATLAEAAEQLKQLGWELDGNPFVISTGKYRDLAIRGRAQ